MSISHRIFVRKRKHKKIFTGRKPAYKKFLGLKTFKTVLDTKFSLSHKQPKQIKKVAKQVVIKKSTPKHFIQLKFPILKLLPAHMRRREIIAAQSDITNFRNLQSENLEEVSEEKFQAFLPQAIWDKMTSAQRSTHIKKRKALVIKGRTDLPPTARFVFSNKGSRPMLAKMDFAHRRQYLKNLIKFANIETSVKEIAPSDKQLVSDLSINKIKSILQLNKKIRTKGSVYKNLTYTSLVSSKITKLIFKTKHAKI